MAIGRASSLVSTPRPVQAMASLANFTALNRLLCRRRLPIFSIPAQFSANFVDSYPSFLFVLYPCVSSKRWLSINSDWASPPEFGVLNAYDVLGVSQDCSFGDIKASFRKLAKETHPDLAQSRVHSSGASKKFLQIVAAYEILSDSTRRAHYDRYILAQRTFHHRPSKKDANIFNYSCYRNSSEEVEVVEWLKWYRYTLKDILSERRVIAGSGYFDVLERDFYSAIHAAYYGPNVESMHLLPECFEAEERSTPATSEVLHLVSGRNLFGMVCSASRHCQLFNDHKEKLTFSDNVLARYTDISTVPFQSNGAEPEEINFKKQSLHGDCLLSDAYMDLELHISGRVVAMATRVPAKRPNVPEADDSEDQIYVYLTSCEDQHPGHAYLGEETVYSSVESRVPLGVIKGLGTSSEEGLCYAYNTNGLKTHTIMKHRTLLVRHLHWFQVGEKVSTCECRCRRARLPPSKFWLFEPRSGIHDVGGWYIETFGRNDNGKPVSAQRRWDGFDTNEHFDKKLHPAMYLLALAYRTLDIEYSRTQKMSVKEKVEAKMSRIFSWYKKGS